MTRRTYGVLGAAALVLILLAAYLYSFTVPRHAQLYLTPTLEDAAGWDIWALEGGEPRTLSVREAWDWDGTVYLERKVPAQWSDLDYTRVILSSTHWYYVFVDGAPVYTNCPGASPSLPVSFPTDGQVDWRSRPGFSLSPAWKGQTMIVATACVYPGEGGSPQFNLTSDTVEEDITSALTNGSAIPATLFATLGALLLLLFAYSLLQGNGDFGLLALAASALAQMFHDLSQFRGGTMLSPLFLQVFLLVPMLYCALRMKGGRKPFTALLLVCWSVSFSTGVLEYFWDISLWLPAELSRLTLLPSYLPFLPLGCLLWLGARERREGNPAFLLLMPGLYGGLSVLALLFLISIPVCLIMPLQSGLLGWLNYTVTSVFHWTPHRLLHLLSLLLLLLLFFTAILDQIRWGTRREEEVRLLALKNNLALESIRALERSGQALAVARHDQLHHLHVLAAMCRDEPHQAAGYAASLASELASIPPLAFTENRLVNTILTVQSGKAAEGSVRFLVQAILPKRLPIPDQDLCAVLMNLLDNARNAAARTPPESERLVRCQLSVREGYLLISIENTLPPDFDQEQFRRLLSGKSSSDRDGHGFGIRSARMAVSRYGGDLRYCVKNGFMTVNAAMELLCEAGGEQAG